MLHSYCNAVKTPRVYIETSPTPVAGRSRRSWSPVWRFREGALEEVGHACVENFEVLRTGDAVSLVVEGEHFVGKTEVVESLCDGVDVIGGDVRVLEALHDQDASADVPHEVYRGAFVVALRDLVWGAAHHLLAVGPEVWAGRVIVHNEVRHAADGRCGGDEVRREVRDRPPRRIPAVGGAGYADATRLRDTGLNKRLDAASYVLLLPAAPAVLLDRLLELQPEPGAPPVVGGQHVEAPREEVLDLGVEPVLGVARRPAVDEQDGADAVPRCPVEPPLHLETVHRPPGKVLSRDQPLRVERNALPQARDALRGFVFLCWREANDVHGVAGAVVEPDPP